MCLLIKPETLAIILFELSFKAGHIANFDKEADNVAKNGESNCDPAEHFKAVRVGAIIFSTYQR